MLQRNNPIDELFELVDAELTSGLKAGQFDPWVHEYVDFVISGCGNKGGTYLPISEGDSENTHPFFISTHHFVDRGTFRQRYH